MSRRKRREDESPQIEQEKRRKKEKPMKVIRTKKKRVNKKFILLYIAGFVFLVWASFQIISQNVKLNESNERLRKIKHEIEINEIKIDYQEKVKKYKGDELDEYIEKIAREDLDYVKNGERVFQNISGD